MNIQDLLSFYSGISNIQDAFIKLVIILLSILFGLFALIVARQISVLTNQINQVSFTPVFKFISYSVAAVSILILVAAILV